MRNSTDTGIVLGAAPLIILAIAIGIFSAVAEGAQIVVTPDNTPLYPIERSFTTDATGTVSIGGATLKFSPTFIGWASATASGEGYLVKEIAVPLQIEPVETGDSIAWRGIYEFPSGATGTVEYEFAENAIRKMLILSEPASSALPSPTGEEYFPDCSNPVLVYGDIDFDLFLPEGWYLSVDDQLYAATDSFEAHRIFVHNATGEMIFRFPDVVSTNADGSTSGGSIYYDGDLGVFLGMFDNWSDIVTIDPSITVTGGSRINVTGIVQNAPNSNLDGLSNRMMVQAYPATNGRGLIQFDPAMFTDAGYTLSTVTITSMTLSLTEIANQNTHGIRISQPDREWTETGVTWNTLPASSGGMMAAFTPGQVAGSTDTIKAISSEFMVPLKAYFDAAITGASATAWRRGFLFYSDKEGVAEAYTSFHDEDVAGKPVLTIDFTTTGGESLTWEQVKATVSDATSYLESRIDTLENIILSQVKSVVSDATSYIGKSASWDNVKETVSSATGYIGIPATWDQAKQTIAESTSYIDSSIQTSQTSLGNWVASVSDQVLVNAALINHVSRLTAIAAGQMATDYIHWNIVLGKTTQDATYAALLIGRSEHPYAGTFSAIVNRADTSAPVAPPVKGYNHEQSSGISYATSAGTVNDVSEERHFLYWNVIDSDQAGIYQLTLTQFDASGNMYHAPSLTIVQSATPSVDTSDLPTLLHFDQKAAQIISAATKQGWYRAAIADATLAKVIDPTSTFNPKDLAAVPTQTVMLEQRTPNNAGGMDIQVYVLDYLNGLTVADSIWPITPGVTIEDAIIEFGYAGDVSAVTFAENVPYE